jgi:hypothetical protein
MHMYHLVCSESAAAINCYQWEIEHTPRGLLKPLRVNPHGPKLENDEFCPGRLKAMPREPR